ncbi:MAG: PHP domain-containing protein [Breznakia sp.]
MQEVNYHTHTKRCGHAIGEDEEYIEAAIAAGFKTLGISDHIPWFAHDKKSDRMPFSQLDEYIEDINALKVKYRDKIRILVGFEFEYMEEEGSDEYLRAVKEKVDYLILGQHQKYFGYEYNDLCDEDDVEVYTNQIIRALDLKLTKYLAHLDYFILGKKSFTEHDKQCVYRICEAVNRNEGYIELNLKGMQYGKSMFNGKLQYLYPHEDVFKIVSACQCKVIFGYDAHYPAALKQRDKERLIREEFAHLHLNFVDQVEF